MKIAHVCATDCKGAGTAASRIHQAQWKAGLDSTMLLLTSWHPSESQRLFNAPPNMIFSGSGWRKEHLGLRLAEAYWQNIREAHPQADKTLELFSAPEAATEADSCAVLRNADIIQLHWVAGVINFSALPSVLQQKPVIWRLSDLNPFTGGCHYSQGCTAYEKKCGSCPQLGSNSPHDISRMHWLRKAAAYHKMNLTCVAPSAWVAERCRTSALLGGTKIHVIPNCLPLNIFHPSSSPSLRHSLGIPQNHKVLLFAAASLNNPRKGFCYILHALEELYHQGYSDFTLLSFGTTPDTIRKTLPFPWHALPSLDKDEDIAAAYAAADAFLLTPREENFPSVALESLAAGTPVVGFATGGIPEIVEDGISGYLCPTGDTEALTKNIVHLLTLSDMDMCALRARCRQRAESFSEERCVANYTRLYEEALRKTGRAAVHAAPTPEVAIVSYEEITSWILGKFATKLHEEISGHGIACVIRPDTATPALISHHIPYLGWKAEDQALIRTLMITHVDSGEKLNQIKRHLCLADMGVCMSRETMNTLVRNGISPERLCFIHAGHDGDACPRKIWLGITSRLYADARKRENILAETLTTLPPAAFGVIIMGSGWEKQVQVLREHGVEVRYYPDFEREIYLSLFQDMDYYLYLGMDEGSMGFIDALAAGVNTIVTAQGFHLDVQGSPTHSFFAKEELYGILSRLAEEKSRLRDSVAAWTWTNYAKAHLIMWRYLLERRSGSFQKRFNTALCNNTVPARARTLICRAVAPAEAWRTVAHAMHNAGLEIEAAHAMRGYLLRAPDDTESRQHYEQWQDRPYALL